MQSIFFFSVFICFIPFCIFLHFAAITHTIWVQIMNFTAVGTVFIVFSNFAPKDIFSLYCRKNDPERMIWSCQIFSIKQKYNIELFTKVTASLKTMRFFCCQVYLFCL